MLMVSVMVGWLGWTVSVRKSVLVLEGLSVDDVATEAALRPSRITLPTLLADVVLAVVTGLAVGRQSGKLLYAKTSSLRTNGCASYSSELQKADCLHYESQRSHRTYPPG